MMTMMMMTMMTNYLLIQSFYVKEIGQGLS